MTAFYFSSFDILYSTAFVHCLLYFMTNFPNKPIFDNVINLLGAILSVGVPAEAAEPGAELAED